MVSTEYLFDRPGRLDHDRNIALVAYMVEVFLNRAVNGTVEAHSLRVWRADQSEYDEADVLSFIRESSEKFRCTMLFVVVKSSFR